MRILLIGNFAPPYDEESLCNLSLLKRLTEEGNDCRVINTSENPAKVKGFINAKTYLGFVPKLIRYAWKSDVIHCLTKGYTRLGLLKLMTSTLVSRLFRLKSIITLHSELFSIIGQMRSKVGGEQAVYLSFSLAHKIIITDKDTYEVASKFKKKDNFTLNPSFINIPEYAKDNEPIALKKPKDKKKVIVFSNVRFPSFLFEILHSFLSKPPDPDIGIVVSLSEKLSAKLQHVIEEAGKLQAENLIFISPEDMQMLSIAYARADIILRPLSCDGKIFFSGFAISCKRPVRSGNYLYFPNSMLVVKEGEIAELCTSIIDTLLTENADRARFQKEQPEPAAEDFYSRIKEIYSE